MSFNIYDKAHYPSFTSYFVDVSDLSVLSKLIIFWDHYFQAMFVPSFMFSAGTCCSII